MNQARLWVALVFLALLSACGGGSETSKSVPPEDAGSSAIAANNGTSARVAAQPQIGISSRSKALAVSSVAVPSPFSCGDLFVSFGGG